jgi:uncharacterized membrane protein (DUF485 family)
LTIDALCLGAVVFAFAVNFIYVARAGASFQVLLYGVAVEVEPARAV